MFGVNAKSTTTAGLNSRLSTSAAQHPSSSNAPTTEIASAATSASDTTETSELSNWATKSLSTLASSLIYMVDNDTYPEQKQFVEADVPAKQSIHDLFDFASDHWVDLAQRSAVGSLDDEMEYCDFLDLDTTGDVDADLDYDVDDCIDSVFTS